MSPPQTPVERPSSASFRRSYSHPSSPISPQLQPTETPFNPPSTSRNTTATSDYTVLNVDHAGEEEGDLGGHSMSMEGGRRRDKGKGRMTDVEEVELQDSGRWSGSANGNGGMRDSNEVVGAVNDEEEEERRVAENLANWSRLEKTRRQSQRRTSTLVMPSNPPIQIPINELARRGSQLIRRASNSARGNRGESKEGRGTARRASMKLEDEVTLNGNSASMGMGHERRRLEEVRETELEEEGRDSVASNRPILGINTSIANSSHSNPFADNSPSSATPTKMSMDSLPTPHTSRFIEDLPPQSPSHTPTHSISNPLELRTPNKKRGESLDELITPHQSQDVLQHRQKPQLANRNSEQSFQSRSYMSINEGEGDEEEEKEVDDRGLGWFDWLFCCGCWGEENDEEGQMGRTNPGE